jgi:TolB-like protein/Tfp pilus assembly protein PilF
MPQERRLAAIMFTDVVGYTALMGEDERKAFDLLKKNRQIQRPIIKKYKGKWLKEMGDGVLASFSTVSDAVYCATEIQEACKHEPDLKLRIGIHQGEIIFEKNDVFGDGVNIASRLEELAPIGGIYVSESVYRNVQNKPGITTEFIKEEALKNVKHPVRVYEVTTEEGSSIYIKEDNRKGKNRIPYIIGTDVILIIVIVSLIWLKLSSKSSSSIDPEIEKSIAVLPFEDMSPDQDQEYLGDGIAEEIINRLTNISELKVIGRTSSFSFKNKETDLKTIGKMLEAAIILEGSVQKSGDKLRVTAQLINSEDGSHIWSERFDRAFTDVFSIQDEIAHLVVNMITSDNIQPNNKSLSISEGINTEEYEYYLKGKHIHFSKYSLYHKFEDFESAEIMFLKALEINTKFGLAHAGIADLYNSLVNINVYNDSFPDRERYMHLQKKHIQLGFTFDPNSDYVNEVRGWVYSAFEEYDSAYNSHKYAVQLNPKNADNVEALGVFLYSRGLYNEGISLFNIANEIDPLDITNLISRVQSNIGLGNLKEALIDLNEVILLEPNIIGVYLVKFSILVVQGNIIEAEEILEKCKAIDSNWDYSYWESIIYAAKNDKENALKKNINAWIFALLGMKEKFIKSDLKWRKEQTNDFTSGYLLLINNQYYEWVKDDPRIQDFVMQEKRKYDMLISKYGNLEFVEL